MKMNIFNMLSLLFLITIEVDCFAQSNYYYTENTRRIDTYINGPLKQYSCEEGMVFLLNIKSQRLKQILQ